MTCEEGCCVGILLLLLLPALVFAGPIPELLPLDTAPSLLPPPILPKFPPEPVPSYVQPAAAWEYISGIRYYLRPEAQADAQANASETNAHVQPRDSALVGSLNMSTDSIDDVEPSIIAIDKNGTVWTTSVYTKRSVQFQNFIIRNYFSTTSDFGTVYKGQLAVPPAYALSGDPFLAANPYATGVGPGRIYASGLVYNFFPNQPNAIVVWRSDDGGQSWTDPSTVESSPGDNPIHDKPSIAVSWHPNTLGHVYVAYTRIYNPGSPTSSRELVIAKSTDGGIQFAILGVITSSTAAINGAQVLVNPSWGFIYVLWLDPGLKAIRMSTSLNFGQTWSNPETATSINPVVEPLNNRAGPRAPSFPMARFNTVANRISVVWHELEQPGSLNTDVYYISKSAASGWQPTKVRINDVQPNDQFFPALDFDTTGNMIVTFYDRRNDANNIRSFRPVLTRMEIASNPISLPVAFSRTRASTITVLSEIIMTRGLSRSSEHITICPLQSAYLP